MVANTKPTRRLGDIAPGTKVRLFAKYRDGSPRPRYRFGRVYLQQDVLSVVRHQGGVTILSAGKVEVPVTSDWRIAG